MLSQFTKLATRVLQLRSPLPRRSLLRNALFGLVTYFGEGWLARAPRFSHLDLVKHFVDDFCCWEGGGVARGKTIKLCRGGILDAFKICGDCCLPQTLLYLSWGPFMKGGLGATSALLSAVHRERTVDECVLWFVPVGSATPIIFVNKCA